MYLRDLTQGYPYFRFILKDSEQLVQRNKAQKATITSPSSLRLLWKVGASLLALY